MPYELQPTVEFPNLRRPIALIVDDPAPCINPLWFFRHQVDKQAEPAEVRTIPLEFMESWCEFIGAAQIRGDFTVLPYPAGLGRIDQGLEGFDRTEVARWVELAQRYVAPQFDIHCEILTHTNALDLSTGSMLPISEHGWTELQDEVVLTDYFAAAMQILKETGLPNYGLTQPCTYVGDESMYARAILAAEKRVNKRKVTHNLLHMDSHSRNVPPRITHCDLDAGEAVVSVWAATGDYIWGTQEHGSERASLTPRQIADLYLTEDGSGGRLAELMGGTSPIVLITHWQSLFSNGTRLGLETYKEVTRRIRTLWGDQVTWSKISELTERYLVSRTAKIESESTRAQVSVKVTSPFSVDVLTLAVPMPWPLFEAPTVRFDGVPVEGVQRKQDLKAETWWMDGSTIVVSLGVVRNITREVVITPNGDPGLA
ncbi:MAG: hypothetical protein P4L46_02685 [Fimbriimonas sp.]|nr:hypothetical protein [Fimbriimonas sp.]